VTQHGPFWFVITTTRFTGNVSVNEYDCILTAPRQLAWWIGRPIDKMVEELERRGILVGVEPL
jgi:hypothetical protein